MPFSATPRNEFFVFDMPMVAKDRKENYLGVAFEMPEKATGSRYTPQGPRKLPEEKEEDNVNGNTFGSYIATIEAIGRDFYNLTTTGKAVETPVGIKSIKPEPPSLESNPEDATITYKTPCPWPRDLGVDNIYPNEPTVAVGVEAIKKNVKNEKLETRILDAISAGLKVNREKLDVVTIPILRRYSMEDPTGKIEDLLGKPEYRKRIINLAEKTEPKKNSSDGRKCVFIATNIIACSEVAYDLLRQEEKEGNAFAGDPSKTVPVRIGANLHHLKRSTLKGAYESEIVLCMSYRRVEYQHVVAAKEASPGLLDRFFLGKRAKQKHFGDRALPFDSDDGGKDVFWIENFETEGEVPAFMGPDAASANSSRTGTIESQDGKSSITRKDTGVFENAVLLDSSGRADSTNGRLDEPTSKFEDPANAK